MLPKGLVLFRTEDNLIHHGYSSPTNSKWYSDTFNEYYYNSSVVEY